MINNYFHNKNKINLFYEKNYRHLLLSEKILIIIITLIIGQLLTFFLLSKIYIKYYSYEGLPIVANIPPSTYSMWPLTKSEALEAKKIAAPFN